MVAIPIKDEAHWHSLRAQCVSGTEVAALFGLHRSMTPFELYHRKKNHLPELDFSDNERVFWGKVLEPAIAVGIGQQQNWNVQKVADYWVSDNCPGMGATLDYEILGQLDGPGVLEIKTVDRLEFMGWEDEKPPIYYELQLQQEMECINYSWGVLAALVGGNDLKTWRYEKRPATIERMRQAVALFWDRMSRNDPPPPDYTQDAATVIALYRDAGAGWTNLSGNGRVAALCQSYNQAMNIEKTAQAAKESAKAELLTFLGNADTADCDRWKISAKVINEVLVKETTRKAYRNFRVTLREEKAKN